MKNEWLREFWRYRELLYFLVWRDVKIRYKQTILGAAGGALGKAWGSYFDKASATRYSSEIDSEG